MNRKDRLKIFGTPDRSFNKQNIYQEKNNMHIEDDKDNLDNYEFDDYDINDSVVNEYVGDDSLFTDKSVSRYVIIKKCISYLYYFFPYLIILYMLIFHPTSQIVNDKKLEELANEIDSLKRENLKLVNFENLTNICKIEQGTSILVDKNDIYKYGLIGIRKYNDPNIILGNNIVPGDCLSLVGSNNQFIIKFSKLRKFDNFHLFHPNTENKKSAIKKFRLTGFCKDKKIEIGNFKYDKSKENCQVYYFKKVEVDKLLVEILSNHGYKKYTTVYKIYIIGV